MREFLIKDIENLMKIEKWVIVEGGIKKCRGNIS